MVLEASSSYTTAVFHSSPLLEKVITTNIRVKRMVRYLEKNTGKYPAGGSQTAPQSS
jgi:hypothetical protein